MEKVQVPPYVNVHPAPAVLIGCGSLEAPNIITCAWFGTVASEPPMVSVSIRPSRFSHPLIVESGEYTVNLATRDQLEWVEYCGLKSGRDGNKFDALDLTAAPCAPLASAPMIEECFISLGCKVVQTAEVGTHTLFVGEVVSMWVAAESLRGNKRVNPRTREQITFLDGSYWTHIPIHEK
ncbi:flavin reductase family protein [bacterium]|nr:flavin reductase family protein [bacterium]